MAQEASDMKSVLAVVLACILLASSVFAETKEIVAEGTYNMGDAVRH